VDLPHSSAYRSGRDDRAGTRAGMRPSPGERYLRVNHVLVESAERLGIDPWAR